ncbi:DUF736 family protein [Sphingosinicella microcystinivorans]|uniref:Uncharacterized protein DUF736 n=1 Tax=Sphingosinicella microcystinivorans TaxID=335406 RepID=A0AAD1G221_SPHMI|nr:DUF736 family protein [Sphingosinicella microcystinivorans]RKS92242.1 uncharacterized protein DUF736 [Sphingosinicella microcystinivorans]BBE35264.1 hypothetical protein SmB9_29220 [Sphingosinicella microcystinivorans]
MNIGEFTRKDNGSVSGFIAEPTYDFGNVYLAKVESTNEGAPPFDLMTPTPRGRPFKLGSLWEDHAEETGEVYFSGYIVSGASGYVRIRLLRSRQNPNLWNVVRNVPGERRRGAQQVELPQPPAAKRQRKAKAPAPVEPEREAA